MNTKLKQEEKSKTVKTDFAPDFTKPTVGNVSNITALGETVAQRNERFRNATEAQKRVMIAKDALLQVKAKKMHVMRGIYLGGRALDRLYGRLAQRLKDWRLPVKEEDIFGTKPEEACSCCAKGALFLSKLRLAGATAEESKYCSSSIGEGVEWPRDNYNLIEWAFETAASPVDQEHWKNQVRMNPTNAGILAKLFGSKHAKDSDRLIAILENIIENGGLFEP